MYLRPTYVLPDVREINLDALLQMGVLGLILDLDNTIRVPHSKQFEGWVIEWLKRTLQKGFQLAIVTNNPRRHYAELVQKQLIEANLDIPVLGNAAKPRRKKLCEVEALLNLQPEQLAIIGDQFITDMLVGKRRGLRVLILVDSMSKGQESWLIRLCRKIDRSFIIQPPSAS